MIPYLILFLMAALPAIQGHDYVRAFHPHRLQVSLSNYWLFMKFLLLIMIGFRYEVGGDWFTYLRYLEQAKYIDFADLSLHADPGYVLLNMLASRLGLGMTGVNAVCAVFFIAGLFSFLKTLPRPWLGLACAVPYLIVVVAMGYTRQSVALGFVMLGLVAMRQSKFKTYIFWVVLGASFHKTAVFLLPLAALVSTRRRIQKMGMVGMATLVTSELFLSQHVQRLYDIYITMELVESDGAFIRMTMNAIPAMLFVYFAKRFEIDVSERKLWKYISWLTIGMLLMLFSTDFSTALDRMALYFIPLQIYVFSYLPNVLKGNKFTWVSAIAVYYGLIMIVWLSFAKHAEYWVPYQIGIQ